MVKSSSRESGTEHWLRDQTDDAESLGISPGFGGSIMIAAVGWFAAQTRRLESGRRIAERKAFAQFFAMVVEGADSVSAAGKIVGLTTARSRDLVRMFIEDVFVELAGVNLLNDEDMDQAAELVARYGEELNFGVKREIAATKRDGA